jgi:hypothetical protein
VAGLHCYAVGGGGLLAHNGGPDDCGLGSAAEATHEVPGAGNRPAVEVPATKGTPEPSTADASKSTSRAAPEGGLPKPSGEDPRVIREGWQLDGQNPAERPIKWPFNWRKPKDGTWQVQDGQLFFKPDAKLEAVAKQFGWVEGDLLPFVKGVPDFKKYVWQQKNFEIKTVLTGKQNVDTPRIATELAEQDWLGCKTQKEALKKLKDLKLTPHHFQIREDGVNIIQLVDSDLHETFRHSGTAQMLRGGS